MTSISRPPQREDFLSHIEKGAWEWGEQSPPTLYNIMNITHINHITIKESYQDEIIAYSVTVYYDNTAKTTYEFFGTAEDILAQTEAIIPEAVINYYQYQIERHTENNTIIIECSESLYEKRLREDMGIKEGEA